MAISLLVGEILASCRRIQTPAMRALPVVGVGTHILKKNRAIIILEKLLGTGENVTAACPDHLTISDLPVAKGIGRVPTAARVKEVNFTVRSKVGGKVHFCAKCNFPIAIYGRLNPCEHAFCRDCALECGSKGECHICGAQIEKIQTINMGKGGIFICGMLSCLKSFCEQNALKSHILEVHGVAGSSSVISGGDGDLRLEPLDGPLPRPTAQPNP